MKTLRSISLLLFTGWVMSMSSGFAATPSELLQQGLYAEEVEGNIDAAIKSYAQVIENRSAPVNLVAQALYRQGMCYLKLKNEAAARETLQRLVSEHPDQTEIVEKAKPVLEDLTNFDPASLMPPGTLVYLEFGSPGRQVETILGALKGTPFENPLAAVAGGQQDHNGQQSPADILGALLNPSMVTEFKKIRSSAIGLSGVSANHPGLVAVLYPGKSDALRGVIQAALGMAGKPGRALEGMQRVNLPEDMAVAYDERVFIMARPVSQLEWCVKQYKGLSSEPTLASGNKTFAKLDKTQRQKNALTVWARVDEAYQQMLKLFPADKVPPGILSANAVVDFSSIEELVVTHSVEPAVSAARVEVQFKDGHRCLAYDALRTPSGGKAVLEAVPAEAIAVASFALSQSSDAHADEVRSKIQNLTGLDIGRELFTNLEQVALFAMPAKGAAGAKEDFIPGRLGMAVTSRDPGQTRQVLTTLLGAANPAFAGQHDPAAGRYKIGMQAGRELFCYVDQVNATTVLSLDREIVNASLASVKNHQSILSGGPLQHAVSGLPPTASKIALVNAGGAIRLLGPSLSPGQLSDEQVEQFRASLDQLATAASGTILELRTEEQPDHFALNSCVDGLPPIHQIIGPAMQIRHLVEQERAQAKVWELRQAIPAVVMPAARPPEIDGLEDDVWTNAPRYRLEHVLTAFGSGEKASPPTSPEDLSADFRALWDENNLYLLVDVTDDKLVADTVPDQPVTVPTGSTTIPWWWDDSVEIYLDADNAKAPSYGQHDYQVRINWSATKPAMRIYNNNVETQLEGVAFALVTTEKGYRTEVRIPWASVATKPVAGHMIGLDVHVNDDDDGGPRDHKITWHDTRDRAWQSPQAFGNAQLGGLVGWWKFDETEGDIARDSSGSHHDGKLVGHAKWARGSRGGAIELDGHGSFVRINDKSAFDLGAQATVACWVSLRSVPTEWAAIVTKGDSAWRLSTTTPADPKLHFAVSDYQSHGDRMSVNSSVIMKPEEWHHVAGICDGHTINLYVDGKLEATKPWSTGIGRNNFPVLIGENQQSPRRWFDGWINDVRVYSYALSADAVKSLAGGH